MSINCVPLIPTSPDLLKESNLFPSYSFTSFDCSSLISSEVSFGVQEVSKIKIINKKISFLVLIFVVPLFS